MAKILIVDDEERIRDIIKEYLEFEKFGFDEASDGIEAIDKIKSTVSYAVVLDIMMPKVD